MSVYNFVTHIFANFHGQAIPLPADAMLVLFNTMIRTGSCMMRVGGV